VPLGNCSCFYVKRAQTGLHIICPHAWWAPPTCGCGARWTNLVVSSCSSANTGPPRHCACPSNLACYLIVRDTIEDLNDKRKRITCGLRTAREEQGRTSVATIRRLTLGRDREPATKDCVVMQGRCAEHLRRLCTHCKIPPQPLQRKISSYTFRLSACQTPLSRSRRSACARRYGTPASRFPSQNQDSAQTITFRFVLPKKQASSMVSGAQ
jgi:hypothetical protein